MTQDRFIPRSETVLKAAESLPDAEEWTRETCEVALDNGHVLTFRRIKMKDSGGKGYRWIYDGRIVVS